MLSCLLRDASCAAERFTNDEIDLKPEPSLESFGIKVPKGDPAAADADADAADDDDEAAGKQQQQQQRRSKAAKPKQTQAAAANGAPANGAAAAAADTAGAEGSGDDEDPVFWVPSDEGGSSDEADGEGEEGAGSGSDVDMDGSESEDGAFEGEQGKWYVCILLIGVGFCLPQNKAGIWVAEVGHSQKPHCCWAVW
jgi:hypothetical protein